MAIRTVVTRGFGNGVFSGTIPLVVTRGYSIGEASVAPDAIFITDISSFPPRITNVIGYPPRVLNVSTTESPE